MIDWRPARWLVAAVPLAVLAIAALAAAGRFDLLVFAAPLIGALGGAWWSGHPARTLRWRSRLSVSRLFEGESLSLAVEFTAPPGVEVDEVTARTGPELRATRRAARCWEWELRAVGWGHTAVRLDVAPRAAGGLLIGVASCPAAEVAVFPNPERLVAVPRPVELPDLLGEHVGRRAGPGVEFAGIREYRAGDPVRALNWLVTARRGGPHVTERLAEQSARVVALLDAATEVRQHGSSTLALSVRGAVAVTRGALRSGDRAGVAVLGGVMRWLPPDLGRRHYYRVLEALLDVRAADRSPLDPVWFPLGVLPRGAALMVFSPLLDQRVVAAVAELRRRGFALVVVDVLRAEPRPRPGRESDELAIRMWRLGRRGVVHRLAELGVPVLTWPAGTELDAVLRPVSRRPLLGSRR